MLKQMICIALTLSLFPSILCSQEKSGRIEKLIAALASADWRRVSTAKAELESMQERAIPSLIKLLARRERVKLKNTMDLIYPGARTFYGHGGIVDYDIDQLSVRAGWVLESMTFRRFGFKEDAILHDDLLRATIAGKKDVPLSTLVKIRKDPETKEMIRREAVKRARAWWNKNHESWNRYSGLLEALRRGNPARKAAAIGWIRFGVTRCDRLTRTSYRLYIYG